MALGQVILVASKAVPALLQRVWAAMGHQLDVCSFMKRGHTEHLWGVQKETWTKSLPDYMSHVTILSANQVFRFYEMCQGIMNQEKENLVHILRNVMRQNSF
jgi:hypothetical protein